MAGDERALAHAWDGGGRKSRHAGAELVTAAVAVSAITDPRIPETDGSERRHRSS